MENLLVVDSVVDVAGEGYTTIEAAVAGMTAKQLLIVGDGHTLIGAATVVPQGVHALLNWNNMMKKIIAVIMLLFSCGVYAADNSLFYAIAAGDVTKVKELLAKKQYTCVALKRVTLNQE